MLTQQEIALDDLMADPSQPRKTFEPDAIKRLAASVAVRGVLMPLRVLRDEETRLLADRHGRKPVAGGQDRRAEDGAVPGHGRPAGMKPICSPIGSSKTPAARICGRWSWPGEWPGSRR